MAYKEYFLGKRQRLSWVDETSYGVGGDMDADGEVIGYNAIITPNFNQNWQEILSAGADTRAVEDNVVGPLSYPFTLTFTPVNWKFLKYLGYSVVNAGVGPYTHTFSLQNKIQSFKLEWARRASTPSVITIIGAVVSSGTIEFAKPAGAGKSNIVVTLNCYAKFASNGSVVSSVPALTAAPFQYRHAKIILNGMEITEVNSGTIDIDQGLVEEDSRYCNATLDRTIGEPIPKIQRVTGTFNVNIADSTYWDLWNAAATIDDCSLNFIQSSSLKLEAEFSGFKLDQPNTAGDFESVLNTDLIWRATGFSSLISTDDIPTY
ncbi:MAG: hypothetical protein PWQ59_453 [Thermoanaerobacterium sp.]|nr:hypothetical protein [Thermoanaerobacterium sp.]